MMMSDVSHDLVVFELAPPLFHRAEPLFQQAWFDQAVVGASFAGVHAVRLFVDHPTQPGAAMITNAFEYYVAGSSSSRSLPTFITDAPSEAEIFASVYGYAPITAEWALALLASHGDRLVVVPRRAFVWHSESASESRPRVNRKPDPAVSITAIYDGLASRIHEELNEDVGHFWGGKGVFLTHSFGWCVWVNDAPVSLAHAIAIGSGEANLSVYTLPEHRRRGHAVTVSAACIEECLKRDLIPTWDCDSDNPASARLALKLGFRELLPFSQLSPPRGTRLQQSQGLWHRTTGMDGVIIWSRTVE